MSESPTPGGPPPAAWEQPQREVPGAAGYVYADVPNRVIALIIDAFVLAIIFVALGMVLSIVGLQAGFNSRFDIVGSVVFGVVAFAIEIGYFLYSWTSSRSTVGMRLLGMQVGNAFDGKTLTTDQAIRRAIALWGPATLAQVLGNAPGLGTLLVLISFFWVIYLLYTTAKSPTKQGFHDTYANSVVVKSMRVA